MSFATFLRKLNLRIGLSAAFDYACPNRGLFVVPREVVQTRDGWDLSDGGVGPVLIVEVQPGGECCSAG